MENKLEKIGQNNFMDNFVKTDDILKDMCGIIESSQKSRSEQSISPVIPSSVHPQISPCFHTYG